MKSIKDIKNFDGKKVLVRVDFNVPVENGIVKDNTRIKATLPTLNYIMQNGGKVIILAHLGRPEGKVVKELSLFPVAKELSMLIGKEVELSDEYFGERVAEIIEGMKKDSILMLENIRFLPEEKDNKGKLAENIAKLADLFVFDAFSVAHRGDASVVGISKFLPSYAGISLENELKNLDKIIEKPVHPFVAVIGGAKVETKMPLIEKLVKIADLFLVGGAIANSCFKKMDYSVCDSLSQDFVNENVLKMISEGKIILPIDVVIADENGENIRTVEISEMSKLCSDKEKIFDIGPKTRELFNQKLQNAKTILWNGALGYFEKKPFDEGTEEIAKSIAKISDKDVFSVVGGGETIESLAEFGLLEKMSFVSMGGGAMLEYLAGKKLQGLEVLKNGEDA
jgi:phosphoglycerate kinase